MQSREISVPSASAKIIASGAAGRAGLHPVARHMTGQYSIRNGLSLISVPGGINYAVRNGRERDPRSTGDGLTSIERVFLKE